MLHQRTGPRYDSQDWPHAGGEIDVPAEEGIALCERGIAIPVPVMGDAPAEAPEQSLGDRTETRARPDEEPRGAPSEPAGIPPADPPGETAVPKPVVHALKSAWVDHAADRGFDRGVAESMTKADLVARFGRDPDAPQDGGGDA
jgi:hypothetical protein